MNYLSSQLQNTFIKDVIERNNIKNTEELIRGKNTRKKLEVDFVVICQISNCIITNSYKEPFE